jgi:hypothetical protein
LGEALILGCAESSTITRARKAARKPPPPIAIFFPVDIFFFTFVFPMVTDAGAAGLSAAASAGLAVPSGSI